MKTGYLDLGDTIYGFWEGMNSFSSQKLFIAKVMVVWQLGI